MDIFKFVPTLEKVNFVETYLNKAKKKETAETPEAAEKKETA